ncbi:MAG: lysine--tRNA ligase [Patescibacteria group bacterium]
MLDESHVRREKLAALERVGVFAYPSTVERSATIAETIENFDAWMQQEKEITLVGRILTIRVHGGLIFIDLHGGTEKIQCLFKLDLIGESSFNLFRDCLDPADFVQVTGTLFTTTRGEKTLTVTTWKILTKALLPLPEKWHGLQDVETRFRKRYLDLLMNEEVMARMQARSKIISSIRSLLDGKGFLEVETPTLQPIYGGGFARPFTTHHNALDVDFYLRISDEMYLKRLLVGGCEKVYEITKVFRNEGIDHDHTPEFTMFEAQIAYQDYRYGMDLFEEIFEHAAMQTFGSTDIHHGDILINLKRPWRRLRLVDAISEIGGLTVSEWRDVAHAKDSLRPRLREAKRAQLEQMQSVGEVIACAFEELVEEKLQQPTIIYDYPVEVSPLAKKSADIRFVERFEAFALGSELGNNYSELNDPIDLEQRFLEEKKKEAAGFDEAHQMDVEYLEAIQHGMPPACGLGIGVDRMVMLLTGTENIKEVILFPTLRPEHDATQSKIL